MHILITNDDGVMAPGIMALANAFSILGKVTVVAPESEMSGVSHALTFLKPLFARQLESDSESICRYAVNGTPADCAKLGILELCADEPDLVVSGINGGLNAGINSLYSGTLGGAREASFFEIPSFAVSIEVLQKGKPNLSHLEWASRYSSEIILKLLELEAPKTTLHNINFPIASLQKPAYRVVPMETQRFNYEFQKGLDPTGRQYYWTKHSPSDNQRQHDTDISVLNEGFVSITPMGYDLTDERHLANIKAVL